MNKKRIAGLAILIIGVALLLFSFYITGRINDAKGDVNAISSILPKNSYGNAVSDTLHGKASQYDALALGSLVGGIILIVVGGATAFFGKKRK